MVRVPRSRLVALVPSLAVALERDRRIRSKHASTVTGIVRDLSGGVVADASVEAVVADRVVAATTTGADGALCARRSRRRAVRASRASCRFRRSIGGVRRHEQPTSRAISTCRSVRVSDTLVVSASRGFVDRAQRDAIGERDVARDIEALGATELSEVLRFVPGLSIEGTGREGGGPTSLFARGGDSDYNVVLIDGVRANLDGGRFDFSRIAAGEIDRVEVVRGAQSSLWGADAMTSVVQIFTKRAAATDGAAIIRIGRRRLVRHVSRQRRRQWRRARRVRIIGRASRIARRTAPSAISCPEDDAYPADGVRRRRAASALGTRATIRGGVRYSKAEGHSVGAVTFGSRDSGGAYDTKDLSAYVTVSHAARREVHRHGQPQLLPLRRRIGGHDRRSGVLDLSPSSPARRTRCSRTARDSCG